MKGNRNMATNWYKQKSIDIEYSMLKLRSEYSESQIARGIEIQEERALTAVSKILQEWLKALPKINLTK